VVCGVLAGGPAGGDAQVPVGDVFRKVLPSVAVIRTRGTEVSSQTGVISSFQETGAGVLISADGKVMTAAHVAHAKDEITVEFVGGERVRARVIGSEPGADLALLQLERVPTAARVATLANSDATQVGDPVIVVGSPHGLSYSLSVGHISARHAPDTVYDAFPLAEFFQTDAAINVGNSGGPMFTMAGEAIGIVSHKISRGGGSEGLGFVVTMNSARQLLLDRRAFWSGLEFHSLSKRQAAVLNLPQAGGLLVKAVAKGSPADEAGLRPGTVPGNVDGQQMALGGDIILAVEGIALTEPDAIARIRTRVSAVPSGGTVTARVLRLGTLIDVSVRLP
jgi:S1-C subfamily serine protease